MTTPEDRVVVGRVVGAHGIQGQVRVRYLGDGPDSLYAADEVWLTRDEAHEGQHHEVSQVGASRTGELKMTLSGVTDRDVAQALRGSLVMAKAEILVELPEGEFYWHELVGCQVEASDGAKIGRVVEIWETGAHDVLVVQSESGEQLLLPTARELMPEIDLDAKRIVVEALPGLFDPN